MELEEKNELIERFDNEIWPMHKQGSRDIAVSQMIHALNKEVVVGGGALTFEIIKEKYAEYLKQVKTINKDRDPQFHKAIDPIHKFILAKRWNEDFSIATDDSLDYYLYGD